MTFMKKRLELNLSKNKIFKKKKKLLKALPLWETVDSNLEADSVLYTLPTLLKEQIKMETSFSDPGVYLYSGNQLNILSLQINEQQTDKPFSGDGRMNTTAGFCLVSCCKLNLWTPHLAFNTGPSIYQTFMAAKPFASAQGRQSILRCKGSLPTGGTSISLRFTVDFSCMRPPGDTGGAADVFLRAYFYWDVCGHK